MRQKLGQHFLLDAEVPKIMADAIKLAVGDTIVEVGPGHGELTQAIVAAIESNSLKNVSLIASERDPTLAAAVRQRFKGKNFLEVVEADILEFLSSPAAGTLTKNGYKLVGNIPYYLTGHLLKIVSEMEVQPALAVLMLQKEVAERIAAKPPHMNRLAAAVQFWAEPQLLVKVDRKRFDPPPEVDSAVLLLRAVKQRGFGEKKSYYACIRKLFSQPRKTILNNLAGKVPIEKSKTITALKDLGIRPDARPQDLGVQEIIELSQRLR